MYLSKKTKQPIKESYFMTGPLEETNDAYSIAKIAGVKMCMEYSKQYKLNYKTPYAGKYVWIK